MIRKAADGSPVIPSTVRLIHDFEVPARETGLLREILVEENDSVQAEQLVARIDDQIAQRMLEQATLKYELATRQADDDTEVEAAKKKLDLTASEYDTNYKLYQKGSKTRQEAQRSLYSKQISTHELQAAINKKIQAALEAQAEMVNVNAAKDTIERNQIKSPVTGQVFKVVKDPGEWVNAGETIMRIAALDTLRVHGTISAEYYDPYEIDGKPVTVTATLARGRKVEFEGQVVQTELEQRGNNLYLVVAEIKNRHEGDTDHWILQPQSRVDMQIHVGTKASSANNFDQSSTNPPPTQLIRNRN
jgi:multidrug resistance efflux pump